MFHVKPPQAERTDPPMDAEAFRAVVPVSDAVLDRLSAYLDLLGKWTRKINLVGASTMKDPWRRHILDSAQLLSLLPRTDSPILDVGSGAGLPGLVLAILGAGPVELVESDARKGVFLREAIRITDAPATVHTIRLEALPPFAADVITARAFAPLPDLLEKIAPFIGPSTVCLLHKGKDAGRELTASMKFWKMRVDRFPSRTDPAGVLLRMEDVARRHES